ncbi:MAG: FliI/YscN family ATPase [Hyphomonas sp.]|uniref:FliI/YscN family ATPase n=1 Tax=Hyphomonas sp. TaxID=87 RepID=UPI0018552E67|nr:FliI/YscN family ATPase [Hyphomonas sp.]MBA3067889.1 FliI/YscN family ATPase [Hyphomonas sp.]MBU4062445.1 FliI/YscN family ATPase [Alphaproteobacteria bacterium]MBU4165946.1 FliI/YscN family ATPase [Alphaproteobacteria bacterium]
MRTLSASQPTRLYRLWGTVTDVAPGMLKVAGVSELAGVGNEIQIQKPGQTIHGEILSVSGESITALLFSPCDTIRIGDTVEIEQEARIEPGDHWLGHVINYRGEVAGGDAAAAPVHASSRSLYAPALPAHARRRLGPRLATGWAVTDTLLPICRGQRLGLFAGSGIGKSTFLGSLATGLEADRVVIALIGERGREVNDFVQHTLTPEMRKRTVVVAATASESPGAKKRAANCAIATAEHFRDQGHNVLFLFDSITRLAEAHRETALLAGEVPALNAFPPSTVRVIAELAERAGPGTEGKGDITAVFSVLVAGSDLEEPVADMIRGMLDGHIILARPIAERGRFPAIDVLRSVSRSLPHAATAEENDLLREYRRMIALHEEVAPMLRANLYEFGKDLNSDRAIALFPALDNFVATRKTEGIEASFSELRDILGAGHGHAAAGTKPAPAKA